MTNPLPLSAAHVPVLVPGWLGDTVVAAAVRCCPDRPRL